MDTKTISRINELIAAPSRSGSEISELESILRSIPKDCKEEWHVTWWSRITLFLSNESAEKLQRDGLELFRCEPRPYYQRMEDGGCARCSGWGCCDCAHTGGY